MADYKDMIKGTFNRVVSKVKDVAENGTVREVIDNGVDKAKAYSKIAKLSLQMNGASEELKRVYTEIGKLYYQQQKGNPEGCFAPLFSQADELTQNIMDLSDEIQTMKAQSDAEDVSDIDVEICNFEDIVDATENDGSDDTND